MQRADLKRLRSGCVALRHAAEVSTGRTRSRLRRWAPPARPPACMPALSHRAVLTCRNAVGLLDSMSAGVGHWLRRSPAVRLVRKRICSPPSVLALAAVPDARCLPGRGLLCTCWACICGFPSCSTTSRTTHSKARIGAETLAGWTRVCGVASESASRPSAKIAHSHMYARTASHTAAPETGGNRARVRDPPATLQLPHRRARTQPPFADQRPTRHMTLLSGFHSPFSPLPISLGSRSVPNTWSQISRMPP